MHKLFPWERLSKGEGFFIPALDLELLREAGLKAAVKARVFDARAKPSIFKGKLGILFYRLPRAQRLQSGSLPDE